MSKVEWEAAGMTWIQNWYIWCPYCGNDSTISLDGAYLSNGHNTLCLLCDNTIKLEPIGRDPLTSDDRAKIEALRTELLNEPDIIESIRKP